MRGGTGDDSSSRLWCTSQCALCLALAICHGAAPSKPSREWGVVLDGVEGKVDPPIDFPILVCFSQTPQYCYIYLGTRILSFFHTFVICLLFLINLIPYFKAQVDDHKTLEHPQYYLMCQSHSYVEHHMPSRFLPHFSLSSWRTGFYFLFSFL